MTEEQPRRDRKVSARDGLHIKRCQGACVLESAEPDTQCRELDWYLDRVEEQALHLAAARVLGLHHDRVLVNGVEVGQGLVLAADEIDPYRRVGGGSLVRKVDGLPVPLSPGDGG